MIVEQKTHLVNDTKPADNGIQHLAKAASAV